MAIETYNNFFINIAYTAAIKDFDVLPIRNIIAIMDGAAWMVCQYSRPSNI
jgi:hypothetical protein